MYLIPSFNFLLFVTVKNYEFSKKDRRMLNSIFLWGCQQKCLLDYGQTPNPLLHLSSSSHFSTFVFHPSILCQIINFFIIDMIVFLRRKHHFSPYILESRSIWSLHFGSSQFGPYYFQLAFNLVPTVNLLTENAYMANSLHSWHAQYLNIK